MSETVLIIASSETNANLYYATKFLAPDPFIFIQMRGRKILIASGLELDRARKEAAVDEVIPNAKIIQKLKKRGVSPITTTEIASFILRERGALHLVVPMNFPLHYGDGLRKKGFSVRPKPEPFFETRSIKSLAEIDAIRKTQRATERAVWIARDILRKSRIKGKYLYYRGKRLTSEFLKHAMASSLLENDCLAAGTIVACGKQAVDPHGQGAGSLLAHEPIVIDIFPHSMKRRYFSDMSRTFVRGKASAKVKNMHRAVLEAQQIAFSKIRDGASGKSIHQSILSHFEKSGFPTGEIGGRMQGFFHSTGHGLGLEIHEPPRISALDHILKSGEVVTVEPGLYYADAGGVRIEDVVVVTKSGCKNLTKFSKLLEI